jgi:hypothetical protein
MVSADRVRVREPADAGRPPAKTPARRIRTALDEWEAAITEAALPETEQS